MALTPDEFLDLLETAASRPKRMTGDAGSVITQPLPDLIAMHQYLSGLSAANAGTGAGSGAAGSAISGLRITKLNPPGTVI